MKKTLTLLFAILVTSLVTQLYAQTPCCTAMAGKNRTICCPGNSVILNGMGTCNCTDTLPDSTILHCNVVLYRWIPTTTLNNPNIAQPTASPSVTTTYTLTTYCVDTTENDTCCQGTSTVTVFVNSTCCRTDGDQQSSAPDIMMYPNPATKTVNLQFAEPVPAGQVQVFDQVGKLVMTQALSAGGNTAVVDISGLAPGSYLLQVEAQEAIVFSEMLLIK